MLRSQQVAPCDPALIRRRAALAKAGQRGQPAKRDAHNAACCVVSWEQPG